MDKKQREKYCEKFGLCTNGGKCECAKELKWIDQLLTSQKKKIVEKVEKNKKQKFYNYFHIFLFSFIKYLIIKLKIS
jgi:hypothetical protein